MTPSSKVGFLEELLFNQSECVAIVTRHEYLLQLELRYGDCSSGVLAIESSRGISSVLDVIRGEHQIQLPRVEIFSSGRLVLTLHRRSVVVEPDPNYEAWTLTLATGEMFVANPGGGVTHWSQR